MRINSLMNNQIQHSPAKHNGRQNTAFTGIEKAAGNIADGLAKKPEKKDGFIVRFLNKHIHLDEHIADCMAGLSQTKASKKLVDITRQFKSAPARWCDLESVAVTLFYMWNTWKSEKIDEERKVPSMIQNGAVTIASSAAAAVVDSAFDPIIDKIGLKYMELEKTNPELIKQIGGRSAKDFCGAIKKLKSNTVFTAVVRFIIPVLMVPVVGKIVATLNEKKKEQQEENKEAQTLIQTPQTVQTPQTQQASEIQPQQVQNTVPSQNIEHHDDDHDDHDDHDDDDDDDKKPENPVNTNMNDINGTENKFKTLFA